MPDPVNNPHLDRPIRSLDPGSGTAGSARKNRNSGGEVRKAGDNRKDEDENRGKEGERDRDTYEHDSGDDEDKPAVKKRGPDAETSGPGRILDITV